MSGETDIERRSRAYRKAGHAVAHHVQGRRPSRLALDPPTEAESESSRPVDLGGGARHRLELEILALWVGLEAEARAAAQAGAPAGPTPGPDHLAALGRRVTRSEQENEAYLEWLRRRALGLLDLPGIWPAVEKVAEALLADGSLSAADLTALVSGAQRSHRRPGLSGWLRDLR
ncbi:MAG: hypothetical protein FJW79_12135 [Actinobacteria bacterium]|nr:hypothetical protein [Actinomycetota bacterium]